jgi:hypothetical protein
MAPTPSYSCLSRSQRRSLCHSVSLSWSQVPIWGPTLDLVLLWDSWRFVEVERPSWQEKNLSFAIAAGARQRSHSRVRVQSVSWPYFTVSDSRIPNLDGQVPVFISSRNRVAQLYPQALGSLFFASYHSQGLCLRYSTRLHAGVPH